MQELRDFYIRELTRLAEMSANMQITLIHAAKRHNPALLSSYGKVAATLAACRVVSNDLAHTLRQLRKDELNTENDHVENLLEELRLDMSQAHESGLIARSDGSDNRADFYALALKMLETYFIRIWRLRYRE